MDLRSIINTEAGEASSSKQAAPVTPVQPPHQQRGSYPEYPQASPGKHPSQDYGVQPPGGHYPVNTYQGNFQGRPPPPPPIQAQQHNDLRSPARSYSAQSPYQHTPTSASGQYPFPPSNHQTPQSPAQQHQYPPSVQQRDSIHRDPREPPQHRDSYPHPNHPPHLQHQGSYSQSSPTPQTPPIGLPGAANPYLQHQRSQSSISTSTPTSAQSQQQFFSHQQPHDSPVSTTQQFPPTQIPQHHRQQSQPGTPLGPPLNQRQSVGGFPQPSSPYQQRQPSGPFSNFHQTSPAPPAPASLSRQPSTPTTYNSHSQRTSISEQHRRSQSERERSLSVSPKTRLPSQPRGEMHTPPSDNGLHNLKRKMEDREPSIEEYRRFDPADMKPKVNGDHRFPSSSPKQPPKKRIRHTEPPIWAQSVRAKGFHRDAAKGPPKSNGKAPMAQDETNGTRNMPPAPTLSAPAVNGPIDHTLLGPWEPSIVGTKPNDQITKLVADFLYLHVVSRGDLGELASRGVVVEIEAKLGQLIDKETNERYRLPVLSECVLHERTNVGFRSSMTEAQHRFLNDFLNKQVAITHPQNLGQPKKRVQIDYLHRHETDKFYELPPQMQNMLPAAVRSQLNPRHAVKVRVSHEQKTNKVLAKIIKARIVDLDIFNPQAALDCRISVNLEMRYDGDVEDLIAASTGDNQSPDRNKDRLSYTQGHYQVDLTQVTQMAGSHGQNRVEKEHELEIEISTAAVMDQGQKAGSGQVNEYLTLVEGLIDNVRVLSRATPHVDR